MLLIRLSLLLISFPLLAWSQANLTTLELPSATDKRSPVRTVRRRSRCRPDEKADRGNGGETDGAHQPGREALHWSKSTGAIGLVTIESAPAEKIVSPPSVEIKPAPSAPCPLGKGRNPNSSEAQAQAQPAFTASVKQPSTTQKAGAAPPDPPPSIVVAPARAQPIVDVPPVQPPAVVKAKTAPVDAPPPPAPKAPAAADPAPPPAGGGGGGGSAQADWLAAHTNARAKFGVGPVTWSAGAAAQAQANVNAHQASCGMAHTTGGKFGENLLAGSGGSGKMAANDVVESWMSESKDFNYGDPEGKHGGKVVYHFTAIVWKTMSGIGCAIGQCGGGGTYVACCYDPFPNVMGSFGAQVPHPI